MRGAMLRPVAIHQVTVGLLPLWLDARRLLGPTGLADTRGEGWQIESSADGPQWLEARATLDSRHAADLSARLRGVGFEGQGLGCEVEPPLPRGVVRRARSDDARRRRVTTPGFTRAGARLDAVGRMSLTPESLAMQMAAGAKGRRVVDAGCGAGGNAIAFARAGAQVVAIEADTTRIKLARHNAALYGVREAIEFIEGDACERIAQVAQPDTILFVDPPWGAEWNRQGCGLADLPLLARLLEHVDAYAALWAKLPPSFATQELLAERPGSARAVFGEAEGDLRRVKFVLLQC